MGYKEKDFEIAARKLASKGIIFCFQIIKQITLDYVNMCDRFSLLG
jgi:hypothetical protein